MTSTWRNPHVHTFSTHLHVLVRLCRRLKKYASVAVDEANAPEVSAYEASAPEASASEVITPGASAFPITSRQDYMSSESTQYSDEDISQILDALADDMLNLQPH